MVYVKRFEPLESDPQILTVLMHDLGVQGKFQIKDVLDYEAESQLPALALIVIFPESEEDEEHKAAGEANRVHNAASQIKFLKQTIENSCGLIAVLHCVLNTVAVNSIEKHSILHNALHSSKGITAFLEESKEVEMVYQAAMESGGTDIPDDVKYHYVALVTHQDLVYELDGERLSPIVRGTSQNADYILKNVAEISQIIGSLAKGRHDCSVYKLVFEED